VALRADDVDLERDRTLVRRFQAGDGEAFDELYRRYHDRLERFCRKRVGDSHTAEELAQEAFTRALTALPDLGGDLRFYPWVSVIAARLCIDSHRRQSRSEPASDLDLGPVTGGQEDIIDAVDASLVIAALARLHPRHQDVLHLREVEGWSYQHIADHYGVALGTVETLLFRARRALRREFRIVDGAGLAAIPFLGRMMQLAGRVRSRVPSWVPTTPSPATVAAAATATAAAVVLAVVPAKAPPVPRVPVPTASAPAPRAASALPVLAASATTVVIATTLPTTSTTIDPTASRAVVADVSVDTTTTTTTTTPTTVPPSTDASGTTDTTVGSGLAPATADTTTSTTVAPLVGLPALIPAAPPLSIPPLNLGSVVAPIVGTVTSTVTSVLGQILPGGH